MSSRTLSLPKMLNLLNLQTPTNTELAHYIFFDRHAQREDGLEKSHKTEDVEKTVQPVQSSGAAAAVYSYHFMISLIAFSEYPISVSACFRSSRVSIFTFPTDSLLTPNPYLTIDSDIGICRNTAMHNLKTRFRTHETIILYAPNTAFP